MRFGSTGEHRFWLKKPSNWVHFCLWDKECQFWGNPKRIYFFGWFVDFKSDFDPFADFEELDTR